MCVNVCVKSACKCVPFFLSEVENKSCVVIPILFHTFHPKVIRHKLAKMISEVEATQAWLEQLVYQSKEMNPGLCVCVPVSGQMPNFVTTRLLSPLAHTHTLTQL